MSGKKLYTRETLQAAVAEIKNAASVRKVSAKFNIPRSTLADHKLGRFDLGPHPNRAVNQEEEEALVRYVIWMVDHGFPLTRTIIKSLALEILKDSGWKTPLRVLSDNWWSRFKARHPEPTTWIPDSLDRARVLATTPAAIERSSFAYLRTSLTHTVSTLTPELCLLIPHMVLH